jgi:drug efflux transport system ATP-binding protein
LELLIEVRNLYRSFGDLKAVDGVNFEVASGEIYGLVGPDGAGKTTTMRLLCGAMLPDNIKGREDSLIRIAGYDINRQVEQARSHIGYLPQRFSLYEDLTVMENLRFFAEVRGLSPSEWKPRCMEILQFVGLDRFVGLRAGMLSGGMKQKLGLAAALVHRPKVLLLDEPTTGVDPVTRQDFWQLIIRLAGESSDERIAVFVSTPYMDEASRCDRVGFMRNGKVILEGKPSELRKRLDGRILELRGHPLQLLRKVTEADEGVETALMFGDRLHLRVRQGQTDEVMARLEERIPVEGGEISVLRRVPPQLEDMFIALQEE